MSVHEKRKQNCSCGKPHNCTFSSAIELQIITNARRFYADKSYCNKVSSSSESTILNSLKSFANSRNVGCLNTFLVSIINNNKIIRLACEF